MQVVATQNEPGLLRVRHQVNDGLPAQIQAFEPAALQLRDEVVASQRCHALALQGLVERSANLVATRRVLARMRGHFDQRIGEQLGVREHRGSEVIPDRAPLAVEAHDVAPVDQMQRAVRADHDVARMQVAMNLAVDETVMQHRIQQALGDAGLEAPTIATTQPPHRTREAGRIGQVFHLDDAMRVAIQRRHAPERATQAAIVEALVIARLLIEIELHHEAGDELVDLLLHRAQKRRELGMRRPILARHDRQPEHQLADGEFAIEILPANFHDDRTQHFESVFEEGLLGDVDAADRTRAHRPRGIEIHVQLVRRAAIAFEEGRFDFGRRHRRHVLVEDREFLGDFVGQKIPVRSRDLRHLDEERPELAHHARDDLRLRLEVLRVGLEERLDVAQGANLPTHDRHIAAHRGRAQHHLAQLPFVEAAPGLEHVDGFDEQRLVGAQHQAHHVERKLAKAFELGRGEQLVEEAPELLHERIGHLHRAARNRLLDDEANQIFGGLLVRNQPARAQVRGDALARAKQRVAIKAFEDDVDRRRQLFARDIGLGSQLLEQRLEALGDFVRGDRERAEIAQQAQAWRGGRLVARSLRVAHGSVSQCPSLLAFARR